MLNTNKGISQSSDINLYLNGPLIPMLVIVVIEINLKSRFMCAREVAGN